MTDTHMPARATGSDPEVARAQPKRLVSVARGTLASLVSAVVALAASQASAQTCSTTSLPYTLANGTTADATQVMADLNCAALYGLAHTTTNVGIGTVSPGYPLTIYSMASTHLFLTGGGVSNPQNGMIFDAVGASGCPGGSNCSDQFYVYSGMYGSAPVFGIYDTTAVANRFVILNNGNVGIDTTAPLYNFYVAGTSGGTSAWTVPSDLRLKKNVVEISDALSLVRRLRGVRYTWKAKAERSVGSDLPLSEGEPQIGFIAQEVEKVVPEAVAPPKDAGGIYGLKDSALIPILVEAIKQQQGEIEQLRATVASVKGQVAAK